MMCPLILGPAFAAFVVLAVAIVCTTTIAILATAYTIYSLEFVCSFVILASLSECYCILLWSLPCDTLLFCYLDLLRLPILSLSNILFLSLPI